MKGSLVTRMIEGRAESPGREAHDVAGAAVPVARRKPEIHVAAGTVRDGMVEIALQDNGQGLDQKYAEQIFKALHRVHAAPEYPGRGIGFSICRKMLGRRGQISANGIPAQGATFALMLPVAGDNP